jgi:hypothetical protein
MMTRRASQKEVRNVLAALNQYFHCRHNDGGLGADGQRVQAAERTQLIGDDLE